MGSARRGTAALGRGRKNRARPSSARLRHRSGWRGRCRRRSRRASPRRRRGSGIPGSRRSVFARAGAPRPPRYMRLESPCQPSTSNVTSMLTMSPSRKRLFVGNAVADDVVDRGADRLPVALVEQRRGIGAVIVREFVDEAVERFGGHARAHHRADQVERLGGQRPGLAHRLKVGGAMKADLASAAGWGGGERSRVMVGFLKRRRIGVLRLRWLSGQEKHGGYSRTLSRRPRPLPENQAASPSSPPPSS